MKDKGISFKLISEKDAQHFLQEHNYYIKLSSYRFNFPKNKFGKYVGLDFFHLKDLSTIDMHIVIKSDEIKKHRINEFINFLLLEL